MLSLKDMEAPVGPESVAVARCVSCGGGLNWLIPYGFKSNAFKTAYRGAGIFACGNCGLQQVDMAKVDVPTLLAYYSDGPYRHDAGIAVVSDHNLNWYEARGRAIAAMASRHGPTQPTSVFEVGAGFAINLLELRKLYPDATYATDEIDSTVQLPAGVSHATLSAVSADIIVLSHVLEHFSDPVALIREVLAALKPGGVVVIEVPNDETPELRAQQKHEPHLTFFDARSIIPVLQRANARIVEVTTAGPKSKAFGEGPKLRARLRTLARSVPFVRDLLDRRRERLVFDFSTPTEHGIFLRVAAQSAASGAGRH